jgi:hypothetical protein
LLQDLVPFLVVGVAFLIAFFVFCHYAQKTRTRRLLSEPIPIVAIEGHVTSQEVSAHPDLDPQLASILVYPGAVPVRKSVIERETEVLPGSQRSRELSITYWTPDAIEVVWEHYRRELPDWAEALAQEAGRELLYRTDHHSCLIRVYSKDGRTMIEATIKPARNDRSNMFSRN